MILKKILFNILPVQKFIRLRKKYRRFLKKIYKPLTEEEFVHILSKKMGIREGSVVFIHSSIDALNISFSAYRLLQILIASVGNNGTILFPAWHFTYRAEDYLEKDLIFDVQKSHSVLGLLTEFARRYPGALRSIHPTNSIVAIGKHAHELIKDHGNSIYPCDEDSPFYKMMNYNGKIIGLGVNTTFLSFVHCPEDVIKTAFPYKTRLDKIFNAKVKLEDGSIKMIKTLAAHPQIKNNDVTAFVRKYINKRVCKNFSIRGNRFFIANSKELFHEIVKLSREKKTIYTKKNMIRN